MDSKKNEIKNTKECECAKEEDTSKLKLTKEICEKQKEKNDGVYLSDDDSSGDDDPSDDESAAPRQDVRNAAGSGYDSTDSEGEDDLDDVADDIEVKIIIIERTRTSGDQAYKKIETVKVKGDGFEKILKVNANNTSEYDVMVQISTFGDRVLKIDTVTFGGDGEDRTLNVNAEIGTKEHPELRVHSRASGSKQVEEWVEATAQKEGHSRKYWYSKVKGKSEWKEPLKYYPVKFKGRPRLAKLVETA